MMVCGGLVVSLVCCCRKNVEKSALFDNLDGAMLIMDEIVDRGLASHILS